MKSASDGSVPQTQSVSDILMMTVLRRSMYRDDYVRLQHMLDATREAVEFAQGRNRSDLDTDRMLALALLKCIKIVGEAAGRVSTEFRDAYPHVPWRAIVAMRNRLVHGYFDIDPDRVWDTVVDDLPPLIHALGEILPEA